jgi:hypothetical protein
VSLAACMSIPPLRRHIFRRSDNDSTMVTMTFAAN